MVLQTANDDHMAWIACCISVSPAMPTHPDEDDGSGLLLPVLVLVDVLLLLLMLNEEKDAVDGNAAVVTTKDTTAGLVAFDGEDPVEGETGVVITVVPLVVDCVLALLLVLLLVLPPLLPISRDMEDLGTRSSKTSWGIFNV